MPLNPELSIAVTKVRKLVNRHKVADESVAVKVVAKSLAINPPKRLMEEMEARRTSPKRTFDRGV